MLLKKAGCECLGWKRRKSLAILAFAASALLEFVPAVAARAQQTAAAQPPSAEDSGPSLEVTLGFIKEKVEAKAEARWGSPTIDTDAAQCQLTETRTWHQGTLVSRKTFSLREVEKITVSQERDEDGDLTNNYVLGIAMTTNKSVHARYTDKEKKKLHLDDRDYPGVQWFFPDEDLANRVAKALLHATELCGGGSKPEPF